MLLRTILQDEFRLLTFRKPGAGIGEHPGAYLAFGMCMTWMAGIGRYWDNANVQLWQHLGLGSLAYVCCLALVIWLLVAPLGPANWSYRKVLLFVTLTSPPAILYAIPVESFLAPSSAVAVNAGFLAIVALWRVALLFVFLRRAAGLTGYKIVVAALLPLALVIDVLAILNLERAVSGAMAGIPDAAASDGEAAHSVVRVICGVSILSTPVLLALYGVLARRARAMGTRRMATRHDGLVASSVITT